MADDIAITTGIARHGASRLPSVDVDSFNLELKDEDGFLGDRASKGAFRAIFDKWRKPLRKSGEDPFGDEPSEKISKKALDDMPIVWNEGPNATRSSADIDAHLKDGLGAADAYAMTNDGASTSLGIQWLKRAAKGGRVGAMGTVGVGRAVVFMG